MTPIKRKLLYIFRGTLLRLRISWGKGNSVTLSIGYHIDRVDSKGKPKWDGMRCRPNTTHGKDKVPALTINKSLDALEDKVNTAFYSFEAEDRMPTKEQLKNMIAGKPDTESKDFIQAYEEYMREGLTSRYWTESTYNNMRSKKNVFIRFDKNITFDSLTKERLSDFINHLIKNGKNQKTDKSYRNTTIIVTFSILCSFLRWAERKGYNHNTAYREYELTLKTVKKHIIFLTWDELMRVYNHDFSNDKNLEIARDCFCFCCFTSLRYSDMQNLRKNDIRGNQIMITTIKTTDTIIIDLNNYSSAILSKYIDTDGEKVFPQIRLYSMNSRLRKIGEICGIDTPVNISEMIGSRRISRTAPKYQLLTSHCGRRTFICNALSLGIPPNIVMKWTGHSDYKAMQPYIDIADNARIESMALFDKLQKTN